MTYNENECFEMEYSCLFSIQFQLVCKRGENIYEKKQKEPSMKSDGWKLSHKRQHSIRPKHFIKRFIEEKKKIEKRTSSIVPSTWIYMDWNRIRLRHIYYRFTWLWAGIWTRNKWLEIVHDDDINTKSMLQFDTAIHCNKFNLHVWLLFFKLFLPKFTVKLFTFTV